jgi:L-amino acid N-acyltransferase YncA
MADPLRIRIADPVRDAGQVAAIYAPSVVSSVASFELRPPDAAEMATRISATIAWSPWLVAVVPSVSSDDLAGGDHVAGYAYATRHRERAGYRWAVDLSVYVAADRQGQGIGSCLYAALLPILRLQGFQHAYAGITPPNPGSFALHEAIGMTPVGTYQHVGYKLGAWWSVAWLGMSLQPGLPDPPAEPIPLPDLLAAPDGTAAVLAALRAAITD